MNALIDWSFVEEEVSDRYSNLGQNAIHPVRIFKLLVVQNLYDLSEREACERVDTDIICRSFVGLGMDETVCHWTELGKFKERIGIPAFERLFYRVLEEAERLGIEISTKRNADSTDVKANVDLSRCAKDKQGNDDHSWIDRNTTDPDASCGRKGDKPGSKSWYGYKSHSNQDSETELTTSVVTTDARATDESQLIPLIDKEREARGEDSVRAQGGDKAYVGHFEELSDRGILDYIIPKDNMRLERGRKSQNNHFLHLKYQRYKIEQKHAEGKTNHHLGKARYRTRWKVHLQNLLIYLTMNLKRIVTLLIPTIA
jgi:IS5 family transposase